MTEEIIRGRQISETEERTEDDGMVRPSLEEAKKAFDCFQRYLLLDGHINPSFYQETFKFRDYLSQQTFEKKQLSIFDFFK